MAARKTTKEAALAYARKGWAVFPLRSERKFRKTPATRNGFKDAVKDPGKISAWYDRNPLQGVGIATGRISGLVVIDIDEHGDREKIVREWEAKHGELPPELKGKFGSEIFEAWEKLHGKLPATLEARTGSGGRHLYYRTGEEFRSMTHILPGVDVRANGGYVVAPPTIHPNGTAYTWINPGTEPAAVNDTVLAFLNGPRAAADRSNRQAFKMPEEGVPAGSRTRTLIGLLGSLQGKGLSDDAIRAAVAAENDAKCIPPLTDEELEREVFPALSRWGKGRPVSLEDFVDPDEELVDKLQGLNAAVTYDRSDIGSSKLFFDIFRGTLRYCNDWKEWARYDGRRWVKDSRGCVARLDMERLADAIAAYIPLAGLKEEQKTAYLKYALSIRDYNRRERIVKNAEKYEPLEATDLDADPFLLNVNNGVLNLRDLRGGNVRFLEHDPELRLSKLAPVEYDPAAKCPTWEKFLREIFQGDGDKIRYLQKFAGYALTGDTKEETMLILYGKTTRNGKSTFVETLAALLGDYAVTMDPATLAAQKRYSSAASSDLARLKGARFVSCSEPRKGMILDSARVKTMTGRDTITARNLYESEIEFRPQFKAVMNTNFLPRILDDTVIAGGRLNVVTFDRHFSPEEQDKTLKDRLLDPVELSGILNWALEGLRLYQREGLRPPKAVEAATEAYRADNDKIANFFEDRMVESPGKNTAARDVYPAYMRWNQANGYGTEGKQRFFEELRGRGLMAASGTVDGKTIRNVITDYRLRDFLEA